MVQRYVRHSLLAAFCSRLPALGSQLFECTYVAEVCYSRLTIHSRYHKWAGHGRRVHKGTMGRSTCRSSLCNGRRWRSGSRVSKWQCKGKCLVGVADTEGLDEWIVEVIRQSVIYRHENFKFERQTRSPNGHSGS